MLDKTAVIPSVLERMDKLAVGEAMDLRTYKRNRSVVLVKKAGERVLIIRDGFEQDRFVIAESKLKKTLKTLLKQEFPRSTKVRLYMLGEFDESAPRPELKKL